jgi:predicted ATP-grasp superfamily ATP-dependent carboligase
MEGEPCAAIYVADSQATRLLGMTRQLVGVSWLNASPFAYCGSIGPVPLGHATHDALQRLGEALTCGCGLRGLFGVDCILVDGIPWPVEVNPRYTASIEVLEYAMGISATSLHRDVFSPGVQRERISSAVGRSVVGKAVLFAKKTVTFPSIGPWLSTLQSPVPIHELPAFADIPQMGEQLQAGRPVLTFFARAGSEDDCLDSLRQTASDLDQLLFGR